MLVVVVGRASAWTGCPGDSLRGRPPVLMVLVVLLVLPLPPRRHDLPPGLRGGPLRPLLPSLPVLSLLLLHDGGLVGFLVHLSLQGHSLGAPSLGLNGLPLLLRQDTLQLFLQLVRPVQDLPGFSTELPLFFVFGLLLLLLRPAVGIRRVQSLTTHTNQSINQSIKHSLPVCNTYTLFVCCVCTLLSLPPPHLHTFTKTKTRSFVVLALILIYIFRNPASSKANEVLSAPQVESPSCVCLARALPLRLPEGSKKTKVFFFFGGGG